MSQETKIHFPGSPYTHILPKFIKISVLFKQCVNILRPQVSKYDRLRVSEPCMLTLLGLLYLYNY